MSARQCNEETSMQTDLKNMYAYLRTRHMDQNASDFYAIRKAKQSAVAAENPITFEHTAIQHYLQWHCSVTGARVPGTDRMRQRTLWAHFQRWQQDNNI